MPDSPAPTTSTSRCSIDVGASGASDSTDIRSFPSGCRRGCREPVVQCARLTEQLASPPLDQLSGVVVVGVEVAAVEVAELTPHLFLHDRGMPEPTHAGAQPFLVVRGPVTQHR